MRLEDSRGEKDMEKGRWVKMEAKVDEIWLLGWERLFDKGTCLFYDNISSYDIRNRFGHLPLPEEISRRYPNPNGWGTGMEDSTINAGVFISGVCDRYLATGDSSLRDYSRRIFSGMELCGTLSSRKGFVLRSVSPFDGTSHYPETSIDQVTHFVHGLWRYFHSGLSVASERKSIREIIASVCECVESAAVPANDYHLCREDGVTRGLVDKMWETDAHAAFRLPAVYAVGWDLTRDSHWLDECRRYAGPAYDKAMHLDVLNTNPGGAWPLFQHQVSLEMMTGIDIGNGGLQEKLRRLMAKVAEGMGRMYRGDFNNYEPVDVTLHEDIDWRKCYRRKEKTYPDGTGWSGLKGEWHLVKTHRPLRNTCEMLLSIMMSTRKGLSEEYRALLERMITEPDYNLAYSFGMLYPQAVYWRHAANCPR